MATYWVSFATEEMFLGAAIIDMDDEDADTEDVVKETIVRRCNPGTGSVRVTRIKSDAVPDSFKNRLLGPDEAKTFGYPLIPLH
jgi:hypothetical protein